MDDCLSKPMKMEDLREALRKWMPDAKSNIADDSRISVLDR